MSWPHAFKPGGDGPVLVLLHGTGGDEHQLMPLAEQIAPGLPAIGLQGQSTEEAFRRFFRRLAVNVLDVDDLKRQAARLAAELPAVLTQHGLDGRETVAIGYSNGANMVAGTMLSQPGTFASGVLLRAMAPFHPDPAPDLAGTRVLAVGGLTDRVVPPQGTTEVAEILAAAGADATVDWHPGGHELGPADVEAIRRWLGIS